MVNHSEATIVNNLVVGNAAGCGGGMYWGATQGSLTTLVNNTFADNDGAEGSAIEMSGVDRSQIIHNNLFIGKSGQTALFCRATGASSFPVINASNVYSSGGSAYGGGCTDQTGLRGNVSTDPLFLHGPFGDVPGDYHLQAASPVIDAGDNAAPSLPATDLDGNARLFDGNFDGVARVDMGAYEYTDPNSPPVADAGPDFISLADNGCPAKVIFWGGRSFDPDEDGLTYTWTGSFGSVSGLEATVMLMPGVYEVTLTVRDSRGATATDTVVVTVVDRTPPVISSASATPSVLSSPNNHFVPVTISVSASDGCGGPVTCRITSVTSNEPVDGVDWVITGDLTLNVRASRDKRGTGRVYTITVTCTDDAGNESQRTVTVTVPR
jgi:hypothetical protein